MKDEGMQIANCKMNSANCRIDDAVGAWRRRRLSGAAPHLAFLILQFAICTFHFAFLPSSSLIAHLLIPHLSPLRVLRVSVVNLRCTLTQFFLKHRIGQQHHDNSKCTQQRRVAGQKLQPHALLVNPPQQGDEIPGRHDVRHGADRRRHVGDRRHGGRLVLLHAQIYARGLSTHSAGRFLARHARRATRDGLPLLPHVGGEGRHGGTATNGSLHELP